MNFEKLLGEDPEVELNLILDHLLDPRPLDDLEERDERKEEA